LGLAGERSENVNGGYLKVSIEWVKGVSGGGCHGWRTSQKTGSALKATPLGGPLVEGGEIKAVNYGLIRVKMGDTSLGRLPYLYLRKNLRNGYYLGAQQQCRGAELGVFPVSRGGRCDGKGVCCPRQIGGRR